MLADDARDALLDCRGARQRCLALDARGDERACSKLVEQGCTSRPLRRRREAVRPFKDKTAQVRRTPWTASVLVSHNPFAPVSTRRPHQSGRLQGGRRGPRSQVPGIGGRGG